MVGKTQKHLPLVDEMQHFDAVVCHIGVKASAHRPCWRTSSLQRADGPIAEEIRIPFGVLAGCRSKFDEFPGDLEPFVTRSLA